MVNLTWWELITNLRWMFLSYSYLWQRKIRFLLMSFIRLILRILRFTIVRYVIGWGQSVRIRKMGNIRIITTVCILKWGIDPELSVLLIVPTQKEWITRTQKELATLTRKGWVKLWIKLMLWDKKVVMCRLHIQI